MQSCSVEFTFSADCDVALEGKKRAGVDVEESRFYPGLYPISEKGQVAVFVGSHRMTHSLLI